VQTGGAAEKPKRVFPPAKDTSLLPLDFDAISRMFTGTIVPSGQDSQCSRKKILKTLNSEILS
jgi:hypothetical protein